MADYLERLRGLGDSGDDGGAGLAVAVFDVCGGPDVFCSQQPGTFHSDRQILRHPRKATL